MAECAGGQPLASPSALLKPDPDAVADGEAVRARRTTRFGEDIFSLDFKEKEKEKTKVCFLSGRERVILRGGHSRLDCEHRREDRDVGPGSYKTEQMTSALHQTLNKVTSRVGYGGLASRAPRFDPHRRDSAPSLMLPPYHKQCVLHLPKIRVGKTPTPHPPFGSAVPRHTGVPDNKEDTPGFYYDVSRATQKREMPFEHSFGGRTRLRPHVVIKCTPFNLDSCCTCETAPCGDYWFCGGDCLCRPCYDREWNHPDKFTRPHLEVFKKIRDCSYIHQHEGTSAAYPLMRNKEIRKQQLLECYFACYQGPRKIINTEPRGQTRQTRCQYGKISRGCPKTNSVQVLFKNPKN